MSKEVEVELGDLGGLDGEVSGEIRIPLMDNETEDEGSTLDEPVWTTLVSSWLNCPEGVSDDGICLSHG